MLARATSMFAASAIPRGACAIPAMRKVVQSDKWRHPESQQVLETVLSGLEENSKAGKSSDADAMMSIVASEIHGISATGQNHLHGEISPMLRTQPTLWVSQWGRMWACSDHFSVIKDDGESAD